MGVTAGDSTIASGPDECGSTRVYPRMIMSMYKGREKARPMCRETFALSLISATLGLRPASSPASGALPPGVRSSREQQRCADEAPQLRVILIPSE
jgi:hypothetical protein